MHECLQKRAKRCKTGVRVATEYHSLVDYDVVSAAMHGREPDSIEHGIGFLIIKTPSANRRFLGIKNGARKSDADLGHIS